MAIEEIALAEGESGLDFAEYFQDAIFVGNALDFFVELLPGSLGYVLRHQELGEESYFEQYVPRVVNLPAKIPQHRLIRDMWFWPILAKHLGTIQGYGAEVDSRIINAKWRCQVRLQSGLKYVGVFKALYGGPCDPEDIALLGAFYRTRLFIEQEVSGRRIIKSQLTPEYQRELASTRTAVGSALTAGNPRLALRHLITLITSHLASGLNRVALFGRVADKDEIECIYAHGGDGSEHWSAEVQRPLGETLKTTEELHAVVQESQEHEDPYFKAIAGDYPLRVENVSKSNLLIAKLWRNNGDLQSLAPENEVKFFSPPTVRPGQANLDWKNSTLDYHLAAKFDGADEWVREIRQLRPNEPIFVCRNNTYFLLPWRNEQGELLAVALTDCANWDAIDLWRDAVPKLALAGSILSSFSSQFSPTAKAKWT
jgi:hypothetical protein